MTDSLAQCIALDVPGPEHRATTRDAGRGDLPEVNPAGWEVCLAALTRDTIEQGGRFEGLAEPWPGLAAQRLGRDVVAT